MSNVTKNGLLWKALIQMLIQNDIICSTTVISFPMLALVSSWSNKFLIKGLLVRVPLSGKSFVNLFVSFQIKEGNCHHVYL